LISHIHYRHACQYQRDMAKLKPFEEGCLQPK